jgi:biotin transport system substrate-specific component
VLARTARPLAIELTPARIQWRVLLPVAGSLLIAIAAQFQIPLPFSPVPVTGQTFAVLLVGAALGARLGAGAVALYVIEGLAGLPVFAGGASGLARLSGPTGGYLVGFVLAAILVGALAERGWDRRIWSTGLAMLLGMVVIYLCGLAWLARFVPAAGLLQAGLYPFIAGDLYKLVLATLALPTAWRIVPAMIGRP